MTKSISFLAISMDSVFQDCVNILQIIAKAFGMTYEEVNIWIFVIIEPIVFILMCFWIYRLYRVIGKLEMLTTNLNQKSH